MSGLQSGKKFTALFLHSALIILHLMMEFPGTECLNITFKNSWYIISVRERWFMNWLWAREDCQNQGGDLVSIETEEEWNFINDQIQRRNTTLYENKWSIGLTKKAGNWTWVNGRPLTICKWEQGEPRGEHDAAFMYKRSSNGEQGVFGGVNSISPTDSRAYICEISEATSPPLSPPQSLLPSTSSSALQSTRIQKLAAEHVSKLSGMNITNASSLQEAIAVLEIFITKARNRAPITDEIETRGRSTFKVAIAFEEFALKYSKLHLTGTRSSRVIDNQTMVLGIHKAYHQNASDFYFEDEESQGNINVSSTNFAKSVSLVVGIVYKDLHELLDTNQTIRNEAGEATRYLNSRIMAVAMDPKPNKLEANVMLKFRNLKVDEREKTCVFWRGFSKSSEGFSGRGCHVVASKSNSEETVCSCNHLTHFAVLLDYNGSPGLTVEDETIHEIITYIGLSLSIFAILLTIILYSYLTDVWQPLTQIRLSLSVALGAEQMIFLAGINATENTALCVLAAALLQYFLMAAFCWVLVEEIYSFLLLVKVYNINTKIHMYHFISWGLPIIMVSISISIAAGKDGIKTYTSETYCWLSSSNNLIWIFVTFVAVIEVLNILILVRVIKEMSTLTQPTGEDNHIQQIRLGIKTCAVMILLLGVTWLFGLFLSSHKVFAYLFTIFSSTQGILIFVVHCVRNSQIREQLKRKMNIIFPSAVDHGNSAKRGSKVNPRDASEVRAVEMQSFKE